MPTDRCTSLIIKGLYHGIDEMWISRHPVLLIAHIYQYLPNVGRKIFKDLVGPARVYALKNGRGIFDPTVRSSTFFNIVLTECFMCRYCLNI